MTDPKAPAVKWRDYQHTRPTPEQLHGWFHADTYDGLGIVCGAASRQLEMRQLVDRAVTEGKLDELVSQ